MYVEQDSDDHDKRLDQRRCRGLGRGDAAKQKSIISDEKRNSRFDFDFDFFFSLSR